jgi:hypothetical protein
MKTDVADSAADFASGTALDAAPLDEIHRVVVVLFVTQQRCMFGRNVFAAAGVLRQDA